MATKITITRKTFFCKEALAGEYLTAGETYAAEFRSNSKDVHFVRVSPDRSATYCRTWSVKRAVNSGALVELAA